MPEPGWYPDPENPEGLRLWNGQSWNPPPQTSEPQPPLQDAGESIQRFGDSVSKAGCSITWIVIGIAVVFVLLVLLL